LSFVIGDSSFVRRKSLIANDKGPITNDTMPSLANNQNLHAVPCLLQRGRLKVYPFSFRCAGPSSARAGSSGRQLFPQGAASMRQFMGRWVALFVMLTVAVGMVANSQAAADDFKLEEGYVSIFNGKDLTGWCYPGAKGKPLDGQTETP